MVVGHGGKRRGVILSEEYFLRSIISLNNYPQFHTSAQITLEGNISRGLASTLETFQHKCPEWSP